jgi:hypothetical protein
MKGDIRCVDGRLMRHDPQPDDPDLETDRGPCPECAEIDRLRADLKSLELAMWQFADDRNWSDKVGCLQWIGKRHAIEYARDVVEGISSPFFIGVPNPPSAPDAPGSRSRDGAVRAADEARKRGRK